ncbi:DUF3363 domain-containing protein [Sphingomonas sp. KR3-1]|uniref:DUF3363 domain-containing protein n=1 Tax=Sphingomonas sp. KR3-1 TaxID=3156611 RepID=UPI0032B51548
MLRGVDDRGENLVIAHEYIAHGFRERAAELATLDLGPRTDREIEARLRHDVDQERLTAIDWRLLYRMNDDRVMSPADNDPFKQAVATGRLRKLAAMGLAEPIGEGRHRLADGLEDTLRRMGERGDIIRTMQRELTARRIDRAGADHVIDAQPREPIVGRVIHRGLSDGLRDRHFMMIDGVDGRVHYVDNGRGEATQLEGSWSLEFSLSVACPTFCSRRKRGGGIKRRQLLVPFGAFWCITVLISTGRDLVCRVRMRDLQSPSIVRFTRRCSMSRIAGGHVSPSATSSNWRSRDCSNR